MQREHAGEEGEEEEAGEAKTDGNERGNGKRATPTSLDPSRLPSAGEEKPSAALEFPGVRFADHNITTKPQQETQVVVESLRENEVRDARPQEQVEEMVEVDWFGTPLAVSTLPDFTSMYRQHYPNPHHFLHRHQLQERGGTQEGTAPRTREIHEQVLFVVLVLFLRVKEAAQGENKTTTSLNLILFHRRIRYFHHFFLVILCLSLSFSLPPFLTLSLS